MQNKIIIYTDGAAKGNPGPGGYGIVMKYGQHRKEMSQGYKLTTNNRMELLGVIVALETLKYDNCDVVVYTDSKYVVDAIEKKWVFQWERDSFKKKKNIDLWKRFLIIYRRHQVSFIWVKGHADNIENSVCDRLACEAANGSNLLEDKYYEDIKNDENNKIFNC